MKGSGKLLSGVLLGAGAMYVVDTDRGARRRSLIRDKSIWVSRKVSEGVVGRPPRREQGAESHAVRSEGREEDVDSSAASLAEPSMPSPG